MKLLVDDVQIDPGLVGILVQKRPEPGGHGFVLTVPLSSKRYGFERWKIGAYSIGQDESREILLALLSLYMPDSSGPDRFFLNRVNKLVVKNNTCEVVGECSEVLRSTNAE